jgi:hypothetical protein
MLGALLAGFGYAQRALPEDDMGRIGLGITSLFLVLPFLVSAGGAALGALGIGVRGCRSTMARWGLAGNVLAVAVMAPHVIPVLMLLATRR